MSSSNTMMAPVKVPDLGITLDEATHTYRTRDGVQLASAGSLVKELTPKFDAPAKAAELGARNGVDPAHLLAQWAYKRDRAADKGHALHKFIQDFLLSKNAERDPIPYPAIAYREAKAWVEWWARSGNNLQLVGHEVIVGVPELGFAGTLDSLFLSHRSKRHHVLDWKSNERFDAAPRWEEWMLPPFQDLAKCHLVEYSVQVSLYNLALNRAGIETGDAWIIHLSDTAAAYRALDLRGRLERWLEGRMKR